MTVSPYLIYEISSGRIVSDGHIDAAEADIPTLAELQLTLYAVGTHALLYVAGDPDIHYVGMIPDAETGEPVPSRLDRPTLDRIGINKTTVLADNTDTLELSNLPVPCTIVVDEFEEDEATFNVSTPEWSTVFSTPGSYQFSIRAFPIQNYDFTVTAT